MSKRPLGKTQLQIEPLVFGGNVLGWTIDETTSFNVLDAFIDNGFNAIDTADVYSAWKPGNKGGESETIIGNWLAKRPGRREKIVLFTKVGSDLGLPGHKGLSEKWITQAVEDSLRRLQTDYIDLYFSHWPDSHVTHAETLSAYQKLIKAGKIRHIGASNYDLARLSEANNLAKQQGLPQYEVLQPEYNLYDRTQFPAELAAYTQAENIGVITYYSLASGFLSGKYRTEADLGKSARGEKVKKYLTARGQRILAALDSVASQHTATPADIALAWLIAEPAVSAPIASATNIEQVHHFKIATQLQLTAAQLALLAQASQPD